MQRLFIAIDIADFISLQLTSGFHRVTGIKPIYPNQLHVTLRFIGNMSQEAVEDVKIALQKVHFHSFKCKTEGHGFFPTKKRATVFWLGLTNFQALSSLSDKIENSLYGIIEPEKTKRSFQPHLTIARIKKRLSENDLNELEQIAKHAKTQYICVNSFILYSSVLTQHGAIHKKQAEFFCEE